MKKTLLFLLIASMCSRLSGQVNTGHVSDRIIPSTNFVQAKNYYLLTLFEQDKAVNQLLKTDNGLTIITKKKLDDLTASLTECKDAACFIDRLKFTDSEIKNVGDELTSLCKPGSPLEQLVIKQLIPSFTYNLYKNQTPAQLLVKAWEQDAAGINYTIDVYAGGKRPNYPLIDSISFNVNAKRYPVLLYDANATLIGDVKNSRLFFEPAMQAALLYLQINERQDPANYEPMALTVNKAAVDHIKTAEWHKYPYSVILIPGAGPDNLTTPLSAEGMLRCRLAAQQYHNGLAPFIMPSGGKAHPYKTKYCEAEEMKIYLIKVLHIPEYAVIMEPHARHTTTNVRNAVRLMFKYDMPADKPGLIVTDKSQTDGIMIMADRCEKELKYVPYKLGKRINETEVEYYPLKEAFQINPYEPLDP